MESKRRSGNYEANIWGDDYVQSLTSSFGGKEYLEKFETTKKQVKLMINETKDELEQLELIENLQRLGISYYHFEDAIKMILENIYVTNKCNDANVGKGLYGTALNFRILRQHGYPVPQEVFCSFMDEDGNFETRVSDDGKGLLSLYEASFLSMEGEGILDMARDFSSQNLKEMLKQQVTDRNLAEQIRHALEVPLHWRVIKLEAKWFIYEYAKKVDANVILLELAKLDFNITQAQYQDEIKQISRWYKDTGLEEKLNFARHRLVECFLWSLGFIPEPHLRYSRKLLTKAGELITIMDDIYDVYGTLDELELFTDTIERWDINALDRLPEYMRVCFLALVNFTNEFAYDILKDHCLNLVSNLRKLWAELSRTYYVEAKWYHSGYIPSLNEYLSRAWISISGPLLQFYAYCSMANPIKKNELQSLEQHNGIIHWASMVLRLTDDLGTTSDEMKRGDVPKSIQCYMNDTGCSEDEARGFIKHLIDVTLKRMNKEILMESPALKILVSNAMNLVRISKCFYQYGDGFGSPDKETRKKLVSLIVEPVL